MEAIPPTVQELASDCDAWIVGGAVFEKEPNDVDVFVPPEHWQKAWNLIPSDKATMNNKGGWKFEEYGMKIDVFTGNMTTIFSSDYFKAAYHPFTGRVLVPEK